MIVIDGQEYDVPIISVDMAADPLDKYGERTEDGVLHRELIGIYFNFKIQFGSTAPAATYAALWRKITEPVEFHEVTLWDEDGEYTFTAYFANMRHSLRKIQDAATFWKALSLDCIARSPART